MAAQGAFVIKIGPKGALGSQEIRPMHSAPSLGQSIDLFILTVEGISIPASII